VMDHILAVLFLTVEELRKQNMRAIEEAS
jgi:hypothetical protein